MSDPYGVTLPNLNGETVLSSDTYNLHYIGRPTFFSSQRFQGYPAAQYDNFYIQSETAPIPFVVNRPGIFSTILSVARSSTPGNWNIVVLSSGGTPNSVSPRFSGPVNMWPSITGSIGGYYFSFAYDAPPDVRCFAKLPSDATIVPGSWGIACWDGAGRLAVDATRRLLDPYYIVDVQVPLPEMTEGGIYVGKRSQLATAGSQGQPWIPGQVYIAGNGAWTPYNTSHASTSATTVIGSMPASPAYFFASTSETYTWAVGNGQYNRPDLGAPNAWMGQNMVPVLNINNAGGYAEVRWGTRAVVQSYNGSSVRNGWQRNEGASPVMIIDAARYP